MKYDVLMSHNLTNLTKMVNERLSEGWELSGGLAITYSEWEVDSAPERGKKFDSETIYHQAIVKGK